MKDQIKMYRIPSDKWMSLCHSGYLMIWFLTGVPRHTQVTLRCLCPLTTQRLCVMDMFWVSGVHPVHLGILFTFFLVAGCDIVWTNKTWNCARRGKNQCKELCLPSFVGWSRKFAFLVFFSIQHLGAFAALLSHAGSYGVFIYPKDQTWSDLSASAGQEGKWGLQVFHVFFGVRTHRKHNPRQVWDMKTR